MSEGSKERKAQVIDRLQDAFARCSVGILVDYRGLTTPEMTALRRRLRESQSEYKVVKNTLARLAATRAGKEDLAGSFEGPVAITFGYGDISAPSKALASYIAASKTNLNIRGGFLGGRLLTSEEVMSLATLPSREVLVARILGQLKNPISILASCLTSPLRGMMGVLQARIKQLEGT